MERHPFEWSGFWSVTIFSLVTEVIINLHSNLTLLNMSTDQLNMVAEHTLAFSPCFWTPTSAHRFFSFLQTLVCSHRTLSLSSPYLTPSSRDMEKEEKEFNDCKQASVGKRKIYVPKSVSKNMVCSVIRIQSKISEKTNVNQPKIDFDLDFAQVQGYDFQQVRRLQFTLAFWLEGHPWTCT